MELMDVIELALRFISDTNFIIAIFEILVGLFVFKTRKLYGLKLLLFIPYIILTNNVIGLVDSANKYLVFGYIHVGYMIYFIISLFIMWFCFDVKFPLIVYFCTIAYILENMLYQVGNIFYLLFFEPTQSFVEYNSPKPILYLFIYVLLFIAIGVGFSVFLYKKSFKDLYFRIPTYIILMIECVVIFVIVFLNYYGTMNNLMNLIARIYAAITNVFMFMFEMLLLNETNLKHENNIINTMLGLQEKQYHMSKENIERINIACHDLKRQISALELVGTEEDKNERIKELTGCLDIYESGIETGNKALNIILMEKQFECRNKKINLSCIADGHALDFISNTDIYTLFSNALDNSIECLEKVEEQKRNITLSVSRNESWVIIEITNYCISPVKFENDLPITTKPNKQSHGYGTKSIRNVVKKYDGNMKMETKSDFFILKVVFLNKKLK